MKKMMITIMILFFFPSISNSEEYYGEFIHSWPCAYESIRSINGTIYVKGQTEFGLLGMTSIYILRNKKPDLYMRRENVFSIGEYENELFLWEYHRNLIEKIFYAGGMDCLYSIHSEKMSEKIFEYRKIHDTFLAGAAARNNRIYTMIKNKEYYFYINDTNTGQNTLLYVSEKPVDMYYPTFCLLECKTTEQDDPGGKSSHYSHDCVLFDYSALSIITLPPEITIKNYYGRIQAVLIDNQLYYLSIDGVHTFDFEKKKDQIVLSCPGHDYFQFSLSMDKIILYSEKDNHYSADIYSIHNDNESVSVSFSSPIIPQNVLISNNYIYLLNGNNLECINLSDKTSDYLKLGN